MSSFAEAGRALFLTFGSPLLTIESFRLPISRLGADKGPTVMLLHYWQSATCNSRSTCWSFW